MGDIIIKNGKVKIIADRSELIEVQETPDGIVFNFKGGIVVHKNDQFMSSAVKQIVKNTADNFQGNKVIFELDNPKRPAYVDAT